jgi:hypothetical protein
MRRCEHGSIPSFGKLAADTYTSKGGAFRTNVPEFTASVQDGENGVLFTDMAGGFWMIETYRIPEDQPPLEDTALRRQFLRAGLELTLIPNRVSERFGEPELNDFRFLEVPENPTCYVDGMVRGGSSYEGFSPDGRCERMDLRFGLLAMIKGDSVFVFMRAANTLVFYEGDKDFDGIQAKLVDFAGATEFGVDENEPLEEMRTQARAEEFLRQEEERERSLRPRRRLGRKIKSEIDRSGAECPHCRSHTKNINYSDDDAYFVCINCGRSFTSDDLKGTEIYIVGTQSSPDAGPQG